MWITDLRVGIVLVDLFFSLMYIKVKKKNTERIVPINISLLQSTIEIHHLEVDMELYASVIQEEVIASIF